ncbi:TrkH family potassium uptake protein [Rhodosalinus halophilus]|uniref:TrkH family potassium uptake protein n=1 Tax=Rhodosalinus halophilus TaxID=2259333 RepID=A0A365UAV7_9RHOB|nr:TrkH family potassium uptake protein [Rhodosalinus halophilus]
MLRAALGEAHVVGMVFAPPFAVALAEGAGRLAIALGCALLPTLAGAALAPRFPPQRDLRQIEALAVLVLLFVGVAALAAPAYVTLGMPPVDAAFESVSAITSTGLTVATGTMEWPLAGHALRAWMQWCGGFAIAVAGVALILGPGAAARGAASTMGRAGLPDRDLRTSTRRQARALLVAYVVLTVAAVAVFLPLFPSWWEAIAVALSAVSTGGFTPRPDSLASYSRAAQAAVMLVSLAAAFSLLFYVKLRRDGLRGALFGTNAAAMLAFALGASGLAALLHLALSGSPAQALDSLLNTLSGVTTAGFSVAPVDAAPPLLALLLAVMVVGGGAGSTAGGIKLERALTFARAVRVALLRLRVPAEAVTPLMANGERMPEQRIVATLAVVALYAASALAVWLAMLAGGVPALAALFDTVSALSTVGLSAGAAGPDLAWPLKLVLIAAMLLGRLEFLALIAVLAPATWAPDRG